MKFDRMRKKMPKTKMLSPGGESSRKSRGGVGGAAESCPPKTQKDGFKEAIFLKRVSA